MQHPKINAKIDRLHNYGLYIATVSIKHNANDCIKTAWHFGGMRERMILQRNAAIFETSASGMIPVAVDKINKMAEFGSPRLEEMRLVLLDFFNNICIIK